MKEKTACFSGHRSIPYMQYNRIYERLRVTLIMLINRGYRFFGAGGARGFDTLAAQVVLQLKDQFPQIRLILVLPCLSQTHGWTHADRQIYEKIKESADKIVYISQEYTEGCMLLRNRHLVDCSSVCICYLSETTGGTAYTVAYAKQHGLEIINLA